ncbi:hypothetical protein [Mycobacterium scrofulaceum]|uniref:DUF4345 domain-containing protein n=1 Tax=Mycobacterium scrofulaceum TaxID=1783 RepID=A0A1X0K9M9_MYCSC|nr:hypothetical protein [Mycobacterium scrofulaceum]ORB71247.1 hypothetical protein BST44_22070 [Mycobacterium scrofulaceum]
MTVLLRIGMAASLVVTGAAHAYLYVHGYRHIPDIGSAFLVQASASFALALLILFGGPEWLRWAGAAVAGGSLVGFASSRTVGLLGFSERGWDPAPYPAISVGAELLTVLLWAGDWAVRRAREARRSAHQP